MPSQVTNVHVKLALLSVTGQELSVAIGVDSPCRLPDVAPASEFALDQIARSELVRLVGSDQGYLEQLYTFSFDRGSTSNIVVSYLGLTPGTPALTPGSDWRSLTESFACIGGPDKLVLEYALVRLRAKIGYTTIAFHLMPDSFSLSDLQQTFESILDRPLDPRNFRRRMVSSGLLRPENRLRREGSHRPAALYRFAGAHDPASYLTPEASGKSAEIDAFVDRGTE